MYNNQLTGYFKNLNGVMRKLYAARLANTYGNTDGFFEFNAEELKAVMALLVKAKSIDAAESFMKISNEFKKIHDKFERYGIDEEL
jgi:hypothetical protein